jgi:hypothetical protein
MPQADQPKTSHPDPKALFAKFTLSKRGRTRAVTYKTPRDRLLDSLANQIELVHLLQEHRDPKQEGHKARKMFFFDHGSYVMQIKYNSQPLDLTPDADTIQVTSLDEVEEVLNGAIDLARAGHFDDQISRIAAEWSETRRGRRGKGGPAEEPA